MGNTSLEHAGAALFHTLAFATRKAAQQAYEDFIGLGVSPGDISLFVRAHPSVDHGQDIALDHDIDIGGAMGAGVSTLAGGAGGLLTGLGVLAVPGLGPLLAVGPVAAALTAAIAGGALGGFAGALVGAGVAETSAVMAEQHLAAGLAIITVAESAWDKRVSEAARGFPGLISIDPA